MSWDSFICRAAARLEASAVNIRKLAPPKKKPSCFNDLAEKTSGYRRGSPCRDADPVVVVRRSPGRAAGEDDDASGAGGPSGPTAGDGAAVGVGVGGGVGSLEPHNEKETMTDDREGKFGNEFAGKSMVVERGTGCVSIRNSRREFANFVEVKMF